MSEWPHDEPIDPAARPLEDVSLERIKVLGEIFSAPDGRTDVLIDTEIDARAAELAQAAASLALSELTGAKNPGAARDFMTAMESLGIKEKLIDFLSDIPDADYVDYLRKQAKLTYPEIAGLTGYSPSLISRVLNKERINVDLLTFILTESRARLAQAEEAKKLPE